MNFIRRKSRMSLVPVSTIEENDNFDSSIYDHEFPEFPADEDEASVPDIMPRKPPTKVFIRINMFNIGDVDTVSGTFAAHFYLTATWSDPKLKVKDLENLNAEEQASHIQKSFDPKIMFMNTSGVPEIDFKPFRWEGWKRHRDKEVACSCEMGVRSSFREQFELQNFPLDAQPLNIVISSDNRDDIVTLYGNKKDSLVRKEFMVLHEYEMSDMMFKRARTITKARTTTKSEWGYPLLYTGVIVTRNYGHYIWNIFIPIFLITIMSVTSFAVPVDLVAERCGLILTLVLTSVAFKFVVGQDLPKISYNTFLDWYILISFIVLAVIAFGVSFAGILEEHTSTNAAIWDKIVLISSGSVFVIWHIVTIVSGVRRIRDREHRRVGPSDEAVEMSKSRLSIKFPDTASL